MALPVVEVTQHVCLRCSRVQDTCCTLQVPLTVDDMRRIASLGHPLASFVHTAEYGEKDMEGEDPWFREGMAEKDGKLYRAGTKRQEGGACMFLKDGTGCTLGADRPIVCKMYPFWADEKGEVRYQEDELSFCYMAKLETGVEEGVKLMSETPETIRAYTKAFEDDGKRNASWHRGFARRLLAGEEMSESDLPR